MSKTPKSKTPNNTLFSYFHKTPTEKRDSALKAATAATAAADDHDRRRQSPAEAKKTPPSSDRAPKRKSNAKDDSNNDLGVAAYDLVWSKLEGHPWWPSIVCVHPKDNVISCKQGKSLHIHVQFFDSPPTRGWVKSKFIRPFMGSDCKEYQRGGQFFSADVKCRKAAEEADAALKLAKNDRAALIVAMDSSESEDESMDVEEETSNSEKEGSGEEKDKENETPPSVSSPQKSTKKLTRSVTDKRPAKRRRIIVESEDEDAKSDHSAEDNFKPDSEDESSDEDDENGSSDATESEEMETGSESEAASPVKPSKHAKTGKASSKKVEHKLQGVVRKKTNKGTASSKCTSKQKTNSSPSTESVLNSSFVSDTTKSKLASFSANDSGMPSSCGSSDGRNFPHMSLDFLQPDKVRDAEKRTREDPDYDPRTLYIPESFLSKQTPAMLQWWILKASHFDTVLFFKMGKFYELFHMDAMIAVNELGLIFMKGEHAHSGFPEIAYGRYSDMLIQKGYKIARIEQTETPEMVTERCKQMHSCSKSDKVVRREICSIQTKGTKRYSFIDGDAGSSTNNFLLAVCEKFDSIASGTYGVCFVDTSIGRFYVGQFQDDRHGSRLRTLVSHYPPVQVLYERGRLSARTKAVFSSNSAIKEELKPGTEFWDSSATLKFLAESDYFKDDSKMEDGFCWPEVLREMISNADSLGRSAVAGCELGLSALGAVVWYLRHCLMDEELLSMKTFTRYSPVDLLSQSSPQNSPSILAKRATIFNSQKRLVLDGVTLANLDVLINSSTGSTEGTLLERVQNCCTAFGKRLFKQWLCAPLCNPSSIDDRLNAVEDLMKIADVVEGACEMMKKLPDLERLLNKIHVLGSARRSKDHPDSRAIFFEDTVYSKRKIEDFILTLGGFKMVSKIVSKFDSVSVNFSSKLLKQSVTFVDSENLGKFPDLKAQLEFFDKAFDQQKAKSAGVIKPNKGVNMVYDQAVADIQATEEALNSYLDKQRKLLGCKNISYWGTGRNRFQMEIPESALRNIPDVYEVTSQRKGFRRYQTEEIRKLNSQLTDAEERRDAAQKDTMRCVFHQFDKHYLQWSAAVQCLAVLDVLMSLSYYSSHGDGNMCRPELVLPEDAEFRPFIEIRDGRHPCVGHTFSGGDFIPNDTLIGIAEEEKNDENAAQIVLVTGPNMGGKSTLMRQVGIIVILAQLGCYVPAEKCRLTPVDRVFTRLGASDNIIGGESTFFVELSETSAILQHATEHSLVLLDELGRGTATYDGNAIACAVVKELSENVRCRTLFSTHYHSLVEEFSHDSNIRLGHMACMVENENDDDPSQETITFLYQFASGACPKSYGFNAARLATVPEEVIKLAHKKAREFEESVRIMKAFREVWSLEKSEAGRLLECLNSIDDLL